MNHHERHARIREIERMGYTVSVIETGTAFMVVIADDCGRLQRRGGIQQAQDRIRL